MVQLVTVTRRKEMGGKAGKTEGPVAVTSPVEEVHRPPGSRRTKGAPPHPSEGIFPVPQLRGSSRVVFLLFAGGATTQIAT